MMVLFSPIQAICHSHKTSHSPLQSRGMSIITTCNRHVYRTDHVFLNRVSLPTLSPVTLPPLTQRYTQDVPFPVPRFCNLHFLIFPSQSLILFLHYVLSLPLGIYLWKGMLKKQPSYVHFHLNLIIDIMHNVIHNVHNGYQSRFILYTSLFS